MNPLKIVGLVALCLTVAACFHDDDDVSPPATELPPTIEELTRADYARIAEEANVLLHTDMLGYLEGETTPERVPVECRGDLCSIGFSGLIRASQSFNVESLELEILAGPHGIRQVVERGSGTFSDTHALGGWMEFSLFASRASLLTNEIDPDVGAVRVGSYAFGSATGDDPTVMEGGATWQGFVVGRDVSATENLEAVVEGEARVFVDMGPDSLQADVTFTDLLNSHTQQSYADIAWSDLAIAEGGFAQRDAADDRITGRFFGPEQQEVAGIFERSGIAGAFGGVQQ